ncbi:ABC transporter substrate-binding protein [Anaerotruncus rubiinfantis]|uniref:ABC transporter substrate-binding protein n=1 Tax=Anaerotruncus rubiinfantis TaxID=1720200 RepID=UPI00083137F7|nr:ABC transporter substrate-binding protein [Anaerotruncus rubiinfantis]
MKKAVSLLLTLMLALTLLFSGCGSTTEPAASGDASGGAAQSKTATAADGAQLKEVSREKTLIWAVPELPNGCDNEFQYTAEAQELERNLYDSPLAFETYYDESTGFILPNYEKIVGSLAESWEVSEGGQVITLKFREGVMSHAGNELTADDFIYKWQRGFNVMGNTGTFGAQSQQLHSMDQIEKIDKYTVKITMDAANPIGEAFLTHVCGLILDSKEFQAHQTAEDPDATDWASTHASGFGPWKLVEYTPGTRVVLDRFDDYWDKENLPWFERVIILEVPESSNRASMLMSGSVDAATKLLTTELQQISGNDKVKAMHYDGNKTFIVGVNHEVEEFQNPKVIQAMSFAIPYQDIIDTVYLGQAKQLKSLVCSTYPLYTDQYFQYTYDLEKAKSLLSEAGYPNGFSCKISVDNTNTQAEQVALLMQSSFKQIGINMEIEKMQAGDYYNHLSNKSFESLYAFIDSAGVPDAGFALQLGALTGSINNCGKYSNAEVDELITRMMSTTDAAVRAECADRLQEILVWEDPYCLYIAEPGFDLAVTSDIVNPQWDTIQQIHWNRMSRQ